MIHSWDKFYAEQAEPHSYGDDTTYRLASEFLGTLSEVDDWGGGLAWFKKFLPPTVRYRCVDGSWSRFADDVCDLRTRRTPVEGILLRHVLEHNLCWSRILDNAVHSFTRSMVVVIFTPRVEMTKLVGYDPAYGVPDIAFADDDLTERFVGCRWQATRVLQTGSQFGQERLFYLEK